MDACFGIVQPFKQYFSYIRRDGGTGDESRFNQHVIHLLLYKEEAINVHGRFKPV